MSNTAPNDGTSDVYEARDDDSLETRVLREYYTDNEFFLSAEWILKVLAVVTCIASSALLVAGGCGGATGLPQAGAVLALACGAAAALLCAATALQLPARAPRAWLLADVTISSAMGVLVLVVAVLSVVFCEATIAAGYLLGPLGIATSALMMSSAVVTYVAVTRRIDAARPRVEPPRPKPLEHDA